MTTTETTSDTMTIGTTATKLSAASDGKTISATSAIVTTTGTTAGDAMNKTTSRPRITMYNSTNQYKPGPVDCDINNGSCEGECIRGVIGNDR